MSPKLSKLGNLTTIVMGQSPPGTSYNQEGKGVPLLNGPTEFGPVHPIEKQWTTSPTKLCQPGDILFCVRGATAGRLNVADKPYCLGRGLAAIRGKQDKFDDDFLRHVLANGYSTFQARGVGSTFINISSQNLADFIVPDLPIAEQRRIAAILDKAEELRELRRQALRELDAIAQSIFIEMFGDPVSNLKNLEIAKLEDVANFQTGYPFPSNKYTTEGEVVKLCRGANVLPNRIDWSDLACWSKSQMNGLFEFALQSGDVVIAMDRPWISGGFKIAQIQDSDMPALLVQRVARLRGKNKASNAFIFQLLKHPIFTRHCKPTETTIPHISPKDIKTFKFPLPPLSLQQEFARRIEAIEQLKNTHRESLAQLDALFASLQNRAFRGEL